MQLKRPSTTKVLASQIRKVAKARRKPEVIFFFVVLILVLVVGVVEIAERSGKVTLQPDSEEPEREATRKSSRRGEQTKSQVTEQSKEDVGPKQGAVKPQLEIFMQRVRNALGPFTKKYTDEVATADLVEDSKSCGTFWSSRMDSWTLPTCEKDCVYFETLKEAKAKCEDYGDSCGGITQVRDGRFQPRRWGNGPMKSSNGERSWKKINDVCINKHKSQKSTPRKVWDAFHDTVDAALEDDKLALMDPIFPVKEDGSIFISIASYRDRTCGATLRKAYQRAKNPEKLSAGIVQQNCVHPTKCMTGTGWANTRRWVKSEGPDPDCAEEFCKSDIGRAHCEAGRVRILRLDEIDALGPFFTRFVNSKMWQGENFYLQIDAHTDFRQDWDLSMVAQMRATKSYPMSVISNYPIGGSPSDESDWAALQNPTKPDEWGVPSALCSCTFEHAGGEHMTVRLGHTSRSYTNDLGRPRRSLFVAAGFFVAHGSIVDAVGFDPFLPYLFMGEEIALSIRFYTNGYDIYAPSAEVLRHEYVRKESPKFWESVGHVYSAPNLHNELTDLVVQRVQNLVRFPEADSPEKIDPQTLLTRIDKFGLGTARSAEQFIRVAGMDLVTKTQRTPSWCTKGGDPEDEVKPNRSNSASKIDVDLLH